MSKPTRKSTSKQTQDDDLPIMDKHGNTIYSKKFKLLLSLDKTNKKKKKVTTINSDPVEKLKYIEKTLFNGPLYSFNKFKDYDPNSWC